MATGGSKAIKDLEKEQKMHQTRMILDGLDVALLDIATFYIDCLKVFIGLMPLHFGNAIDNWEKWCHSGRNKECIY